uniref:Uncharacterized protein n=2 Tax=Cacopsylla melanoneura TaxID=428564 RepID=A0A8D8XDZ3_9HEMI
MMSTTGRDRASPAQPHPPQHLPQFNNGVPPPPPQLNGMLQLNSPGVPLPLQHPELGVNKLLQLHHSGELPPLLSHNGVPLPQLLLNGLPQLLQSKLLHLVAPSGLLQLLLPLLLSLGSTTLSLPLKLHIDFSHQANLI